ncbi:MAG: hypothetical protein ABIH49_01770 [archaeon]
MKIKFLLLFAFLFLLPLISAVEFDIKTNFSQGETLIAKISGNFFESIAKEDILFYRGHVRTSVEPFIKRIDNDFYIYASLLGKNPGNYSIVIKNAKYFQIGEFVEEDLQEDFIITDSVAEFSITPGFVATDKDFFLEVQNLRDNEIEIGYAIANESSEEGFFSSLFGNNGNENTISLDSGEIKKINFQASNFTPLEISFIELNSGNTSYSIPVYITSQQISEDEDAGKNLVFETSVFNVSLSTNSDTSRIVFLKNTGTEKIENINLSLSNSLIPYVNLSVYKIDEIGANESEKIEITFSSDAQEKNTEGQITAKTSDVYAYLAVFLNFVEGYQPVNETNDENELISNCAELGGKICTENQKCSGDIEYAGDGICCLAECTQTKNNPAGKIIGWSMIVAILLLALWFYLKKYKKVERKTNILNIMKK